MKKEKILISIIIICLLLSVVKICGDYENINSNISNIFSSFVLIIIAGIWFGLPFRLLYRLFDHKSMRFFCLTILVFFFICQSICCLSIVIQTDYENYYIGQCISSGIFLGIFFARKKAYKKLGYSLEKETENQSRQIRKKQFANKKLSIN